MAASDVAICNSALNKLGGEQITSLSDNTRRAKLCNLQYDTIRKKILRSHPWNFAIKRSFLIPVTDTSTSVNDGTDTFTSGATLNMATGDIINITLNSGTLPAPLIEGQAYHAIKLTTTTFQLAVDGVDAANGTAIDITDSPTFNATFSVGAPFEFESKYTLPSDMLRAIREDDKSLDWKIEGQFLYTNKDSFKMVYIADISDTTQFDENFDELFALTLAFELAYPLVQSNSLKEQLNRELQEALRDVRSFDAQEGQPEFLETNEWLVSRQ